MSDADPTHLEQAFERAAEARTAIAGVIDRVRAGDQTLQQAFDDADEHPFVGRCFAVKVFEAVPGIGKVRARRTMEELGLDEGIWLRDVPGPTRTAVIEAFARPAT